MPGPGNPTPQGVSVSLDAVSQVVGSILIRTVTGWSYLDAGPAGWVLTSNGPGQLPTWTQGPPPPPSGGVEAFMQPPPDPARLALIIALRSALQGAGVWAKLDLLYLLAAHAAQPARLNWIQPIANTLTPINAPTFTTDRGYTGDGASTKLLPGANLDQLARYTRDSAHVAAWSLSTTAHAGAEVGTSMASFTMILTRYLNGSSYDRVNGFPYLDYPSSPGNGLYHANRSGSGVQQLYRNGALVTTASGASEAIGAGIALEYLSDSGDNFYSNKQLAAVTTGASLDATEAAALHSALANYLTALGAI